MYRRASAIIAASILSTASAAVFILATPAVARANTAGNNCWDGIGDSGNLAHAFANHTFNHQCDADGAHDAEKPDKCSQHHFNCT